MHLLRPIARYAREFIADIRNDKFDRVDGGVILKSSAFLTGTYIEGVKGDPDSFRRHSNLIPDQGILTILGIALYTDAKINTYYIAPFSGSSTPAANWTASNFTSNATEITSGSEGYSQSTRVQWVPAAPATNKVTNVASLANFTIVTASQLNINGAGLLSASAKGATSGVLISAAKYTATRVLNNTDTWQSQYEVSLSDS